MSESEPRRSHGSRDTSVVRILMLVLGTPALVLWLFVGGHQPAGRAEFGVCLSGAIALFFAVLMRAWWRRGLFNSHVWSGPFPWRATLRCADMKPEEDVAVSGRVVRCEDVATSPLSGRTGFFVRVEVDAYGGGNRQPSRWQEVHEEAAGGGYWISDGSGELYVTSSPMVNVERDGSTVCYASDCGIQGLPDEAEHFIRSREEIARYLRPFSRIRVYETVATTGALVTVVGALTQKVENAYRGSGGEPRARPLGGVAFLGDIREMRAYLLRPGRRRLLLDALIVVGAVVFAVGAALFRNSSR